LSPPGHSNHANAEEFERALAHFQLAAHPAESARARGTNTPKTRRNLLTQRLRVMTDDRG
jgi:hypothetical protein